VCGLCLVWQQRSDVGDGEAHAAERGRQEGAAARRETEAAKTERQLRLIVCQTAVLMGEVVA